MDAARVKAIIQRHIKAHEAVYGYKTPHLDGLLREIGVEVEDEIKRDADAAAGLTRTDRNDPISRLIAD